MHAFQLAFRGGGSERAFVIAASTAEEKASWVSRLTSLLSSACAPGGQAREDQAREGQAREGGPSTAVEALSSELAQRVAIS